MQGRLLPKYKSRYQAFPINTWANEFEIAKSCGFDLIEFIFDFNDAESNPLLSTSGIDEINFLINKTGVSVKTICADYFMEAPLHSTNVSVVEKSRKILIALLHSVSRLNITNVIIPCVDNSSLNDVMAMNRFVIEINKLIPLIESYNINLSLETDLAPKPFKDLLSQFKSKNITVNYDIGNSASLGFDSDEELEAYGHWITDVHIKDRLLGGPSVLLGEGDANFHKFFEKLKKYSYDGPFIMQAYRDDEGVEILKKQLKTIRTYIDV
jgi:L-ribulose-5-phosphate 3-epimerase UlaE